MIPKELKLFFCAVQFLTRIPTPALRDFQPEWIQQSARYYPLVGALVGGIAAAVLYAASHIWTPLITAILCVAASMAVTGCFHEDGLADTADGIGGGQTRDRRLEIMKDSRLGTYGASVLILNLGLKVACLSTLVAINPILAVIGLIGSNTFGRTAAVMAMAIMPYGGHHGMAKEGKPDKTSSLNVIIALAFGILSVIALPSFAAPVAVLAGLTTAAVPALLAWRLLGGRTGDVLGAVEQCFEIGFLLALSAVLTQ